MKKKLLGITLAACMFLTSFAGCGGKTSENDSSAVSSADPAATTVPADAASEEGYNFSDREFVTLKILMFGDTKEDRAQAVSKALSEITKEKLNCDVEISYVGFGSYEQQLNLKLSSGEELDLFSPFSLSPATLANAGQILPLNDLLESYGKETYDAISQEDWKCTMVGGEIYGLPVNIEKAHTLGFQMRKDILDELGISVDSIKSFDDLHDVLVKVKEAHPDIYPVVPDYANTFSRLEVDSLGDGNGVLVNPYESDSLQVVNLAETDYFYDLCEKMYNWAQEGLIMPDASTNSESSFSLMGAGKAFGSFTNLKPGFESEASRRAGTEIVTWSYRDAISTTDDLGLVWSISSTSVDPERAIALYNLMYTDPEVSNLCINGIEGEDYQIIDSDKGIIDYPEGKTAADAGYMRLAWGWPNEMISYVWNGDKETVWSDLDAYNKSALQSPAKGFKFDNSSVINEITACTNVGSKYYQALTGGQIDPAEAIPKYIEELKANGIDTIIAEKQKQLDEWAKANK